MSDRQKYLNQTQTPQCQEILLSLKDLEQKYGCASFHEMFGHLEMILELAFLKVKDHQRDFLFLAKAKK
jgi:hypothetical protein